MNAALGNVGQTAPSTDPSKRTRSDQVESFAISPRRWAPGGGRPRHRSNPVYTAPADLQFAGAMSKVRLRVHLSAFAPTKPRRSVTGRFPRRISSRWATHARSTNGVGRPAADRPACGGRSAHEFLAAFSDRPERSSYQAVREFWQARHPSTIFELFLATHGARRRHAPTRRCRSVK